MKKTAIVSCYFQHNYGSMLQAYATQMVLDKLGYENETIDISGFDGEIKKAKILYFIKASLTSDILITKIGRAKDAVVRKLKKNNYTRNVEARDEAFRRFKKEHFEMSPAYKSKKELSDNCSRYKAVLVGSDQLWLPGNIAADYYTLNFVPDEINTVAYATSFGQSSLPKDTTKLAKVFLSKIKHISVREESGARIVNNITGRTVPVVCDPTLLFDGKDWMIIQEEAPIIEGEYIFVYFLGNNLLHREFVTRLKKETNLKVVCLPHIDEYVEADEACSDIRLYDVDPGQFLNLIRNAKYVCTDSFHCSAFSIQYEKNFFTFRRFSNTSRQSTNSRLETLFNMTGIEDKEKPILTDIKRRIQTIVVPYFSFGLLVLLYWQVIERRFRDSDMSFTESLIGLFSGSYNNLDFNVHLWFLPCFFVTVVLFNILVNLGSRKTAYIVSALMSLIYVILPMPELLWGFNRVFKYIGFYAVGVSLAGRKTKIADRKIGTGVTAVVLLTVNFILSLYNLTTGIMWFVTALIGVAAVILVSQFINENRILQYFGRISLIVLCIHGPVYRVVVKIISIPLHMGTDAVREKFLLAMLVMIVTMVICSLAYEIIVRVAPWMIGKKKVKAL